MDIVLIILNEKSFSYEWKTYGTGDTQMASFLNQSKIVEIHLILSNSFTTVRRKKEARQPHEQAERAKKLHGLKAKLYNKKRHAEKVQMKKTIKMHEEKKTKTRNNEKVPEGAVPAYLLDREGQSRAKILSNMVKQKRKEKAGKWDVPLPKVRAVGEDEVFKVVKTGKTRRKGWKRMVTKACYVGEGFTRKPPKFERFIRPMGLRYKKVHVTHPEVHLYYLYSILVFTKSVDSNIGTF
ncbi:hypothetical protein QZH41_012940 [Actinostola sp. cb2023]|nr:hypothetical protein QZH41_012940 [Actinostola sp. cb2023]